MLNLGQIRFGLGVDTADLSQAVQRVQNFGRAVESAARAQGQNARTVEAALRRQEQAAVRGLQSVLNFNQAARRMNIPTESITRANVAFDALSARMTRGRLNALEFQRAMIAFQNQMSIVNRNLTAFKPTPPGAELKVWMQDLASAAVLAGGPLSGLGARITSISAIVGRSSIALAAFTAGMTAAGVAIYKLSEGAIRTSMELQQVRVRLDALNESTTESKIEYAELQQLADKTGTSFITLAQSYTRAKAAAAGTSLEGDKLKEVFQNLATASAKFGLSQTEFEGTMRAVEQMISKGTVQAEELRGQMGDRLVGAFQAAAAAVGVTTRQLGEMMKKGEVLTSEFLVPFSREVLKRLGGSSVGAVETLRAALGRLGNAVLDFQDAFDQAFGVSQAFKNSVDTLTGAINYVTQNITSFAAAMGGVAASLVALALPSVINLFMSLARAIIMATAAMAGLNGAMMANPILGLIALLTRLAVAAGVGYASFLALKQAMDTSGGATQALITNVDEYIKAQEGMKTAVRSTTTTLIAEVQKQITAIKIQLSAINAMKRSTEGAAGFGTGAKANRADITGSEYTDNLRKQFGQPPKWLTDMLGVSDMAQTNAEKFKQWDAENRNLTDSLSKLEAQLADLNKISQKPETGSLVPPMSTENADTEAEIRRKMKALRESQQLISGLQEEISAMEMGPVFFEEWQKMDEINDKVSQFRDRLTDAGLSTTQINELTDQYLNTLMRVREVTEGPFAAAMEAYSQFKDVATNAFQSVAQAMAQMVMTGEFSAQTFVDIVTKMVQQIIEQLLLLAIMNPIMNAMVPGSNLPAFFDFGAKGMAFSGGVKKMAKGDILNGPTLFKHQSGMAVGGEAGTEAVMPLTRDGSGNLGVRAVGNTDSGNIQVNIFNRAPTKVKAREERRGGQRSLILEIDEINAGLIASGNSRTSSVLGRRGAPPQRNLRS